VIGARLLLELWHRGGLFVEASAYLQTCTGYGATSVREATRWLELEGLVARGEQFGRPHAYTLTEKATLWIMRNLPRIGELVRLMRAEGLKWSNPSKKSKPKPNQRFIRFDGMVKLAKRLLSRSAAGESVREALARGPARPSRGRAPP
jgi:hypothetical protein